MDPKKDLIPIFSSKNPLLAIFVSSILVSALVGASFGYYASQISLERNYFGENGSVGDNRKSDEESVVIDLVARATPAVVSIKVFQDLRVSRPDPNSFFFDDPFFQQFFSAPPTRPSDQTQRVQVSAGSGFIVSENGLIVTNRHVVEGQSQSGQYLVLTNDGQELEAEVLARHPYLDLAILKIEISSAPTLSLGDSDSLAIGQTVVAVGNALGEFTNSVSKGIISGLARSIVTQSGLSSEELREVIQTDTAINPGNSGGPLLNLAGEVIGVNSAIAQGAENIGFAIPINQVRKSIEDVEKTGKIAIPFLGVRYSIITPEIKGLEGLEVDHGAWIVGDERNPAVLPGSPAESAGLRENDIVLEIDGVLVSPEKNLSRLIQTKEVGQEVTLKVLRQGKELRIKVRLAQSP